MTFEGEGCPPVEGGHRSKMRRAAKIAIPTTAALGAGAIIASAAIPAADGTITACYTKANPGGAPASFRVVDSSADCANGETALSWNQRGPAGPQGSQGPAGANGANGQNGTGGSIGGSVFPAAASDYLLEIENIKGESGDKKHKDAIQIESWSLGASNPASTKSSRGGGGAGKVKFHDISITKQVDAASPVLMKYCASGQHIKKAQLFVRKAGGEQNDYLVITLTDVLVSSYQVGSQEPKGPGEVETLTLNYAKIQQEAVGPTGAASKAGWDIKKNQAA